MKTFDDLEFGPHPNTERLSSYYLSMCPEAATAKQATMDFPNGWGVSVLFGSTYYSDGVDTYELAVLHGDGLHYQNPVADGDVCGYLSQSEVTDLMREIQEYSEVEADVVSEYNDRKKVLG